MYELDVVGPESLGRFVYRWYGPPDRPVVAAPDESEMSARGQAVPEALREWHRLARRYSYPLSRDHVMLVPEIGDIGREYVEFGEGNGGFREGGGEVGDGSGKTGERKGMVRFWQGADDWYSYDSGAFRSGALDPEVIENDELPTGISLSRFLVYAAVYEATYAPLHGLVCMKPGAGQVRDVKVRLRPLDDGLWQWPDPTVRYYGDDDLLGHLGPDRIVIAGRHRDALGRFDGLGIAWDWDTRTV